MARMIDADALPVHKAYCVDEAGWGANFYVVDKSDIDKAPTIDAVPVVRCKECIHRGKPIETDYGVDVEFSEYSKCPFYCEDPWYSQRMEDDFYCPRGERRSDD